MESEKKQTIKEIIEILKEIEIIGSNSALKHINTKDCKFTSKSLFKYKIDFIKSLYEEISNKLFELGERDENESLLSNFSPSKSIKYTLNDNSNDPKDILNSVFDYFKSLEIQFSLFNQSLDLCLEKWKILTKGKKIKKNLLDDESYKSSIADELISKFERKNFHNIESFTRCLETLEKDKYMAKGKIDSLLSSFSSKDIDMMLETESLFKKKKLNKSTSTVAKNNEIIEEGKKEVEVKVVVEKIYLGLMECNITKTVDKISDTLSDTNSSTCLSVQSDKSFLAIQESYGMTLIIDNQEFFSSKPKKCKQKNNFNFFFQKNFQFNFNLILIYFN